MTASQLVRASGEPSFDFVCPSNWRNSSGIRIETIIVNPSRMSFPSRFLSFSFKSVFFRAYSFMTRVIAVFAPTSCVPPSRVRTLLTNERTFSEYASVNWKAISTSISFSVPSNATVGCSVSLSSFKYWTNSLTPSWYWKISCLSDRSSVSVIFRPFSKKADSRKRSASVS